MAIFKQIQKAGVIEKYASVNFMKIDVNRGKIQISAPIEGQPVQQAVCQMSQQCWPADQLWHCCLWVEARGTGEERGAAVV